MVLDYLIVGSGRCGTKYCQQLLCSLGIGCSHEAVFHINVTNAEIYPLVGEEYWHWKEGYVAESSFMAAPFLSNPILTNTKIIHLIRDPIKVIQSFVGLNFFSGKKGIHLPYENFIYNFLPELRHVENDPISKSIWYYKLWNDMIFNGIKNKNHITFFIDYHNPEKILRFVNSKKEKYFSDKKCNSRQKAIIISKNDVINNKYFPLIKKYQIAYL